VSNTYTSAERAASKLRATRAYLAFSAWFFVVAIGSGFVIAAHKGYGAGPWNSHRVWSCFTPGGPYYLADRPRSQQPCPSPYSAGLIGRRLASQSPPHPK
jgi:hypothetical protein